MTDKVQKIREEVERLKGWNNNVRNSTRHMTLQEEDFNRGKHSSYLEILNFIDSLQKEPVKIKKGCKYRCLSDMVNNDTGNISFVAGKIYLAPEDDTLVSEENGWRCDTSKNSSNFELVEGPISEEKLSNVERIGKEGKEPASEELKECKSKIILEGTNFNKSWYAHPELAIKAGAQWQLEQMKEILRTEYEKGRYDMREQMLSKAVECEVKIDAGGYPYIPAIEFYDYDKDVPLAKKGDKYKVILIKED